MRRRPLVKNYKYRNAIAKLRASSHNLEIEQGRHANPTTPLHVLTPVLYIV